MPYVQRDEEGAVVAVFLEPHEGAEEEVPVNSPDLITFLQGQGGEVQALSSLIQSDLEMIRVIEDLVDVLVDKNLIQITDLPEAARNKLLRRRGWRGDLESTLEAFGGGKVI